MPAGVTRPPRLLMTTDAVGGVWTYALDLAGALGASGVEIALAVLGPAPTLAQRRRAEATAGVVVTTVEGPLDWTAGSEADLEPVAEAVARLAGDVGADLVHLNSPALAALARFDRPVLGACHSCVASWWAAVRGGEPPADFAWRKDLLARGYAACDLLVAPSAAFAAETERLYGMRPLTVWNGRHRPAAGRWRRREPFALTAGRLWDEGKNIVTLDRATARMRHSVVALGEPSGPDGSALRPAHLRALGRQDAVAVADWMARASVFVVPALYEPFGLAVLEAAQAGAALVLADIPTFRELWRDAALFVPPRDADALAETLDRLLDREAERASFARRAGARARRYTVEAMAAGALRAYARVSPAFEAIVGPRPEPRSAGERPGVSPREAAA